MTPDVLTNGEAERQLVADAERHREVLGSLQELGRPESGNTTRAVADRPPFHLKERVTSADVRDPHVAAQLIERIGWALADAEDAERGRARQSS